MRRLSVLIAACSAFALATAAHASDVDVAPLATSQTQLGDNGTVTHGAPGIPAGTANLTDGDRGLNYTSSYNITSSEISFESGGIGVGDQTRTNSVSRIDMTVTNHSDGSLTPVLSSQITAAGMGIYLGDNSAGNCFTAPGSCAQSQGSHTFAELGQLTGANSVAGVNVDFTILQDGNTTLYHVSGGIDVTQDGRIFVFGNVDQLQSNLDGFATLDQFGHIDPTTGRSTSALGFAWNATDITLDNLNSIGSSDSSTISYIVTVSTFNNAGCFGDGACLVTYAGFGDPIGRGGGISSAARVFGGDQFGVFGNDSPEQFIGGVNFSPETLVFPHLDGDTLVFNAPGAPEPSTWALSIMGFGLLGAALRRRRVLAYAG